MILEICSIIVLTVILVVAVCIIIILFDRNSGIANRKDVARMNREIVKYDRPGWLVLVDYDRKVVGLYNNQVATSHAQMQISKEVAQLIKSGVTEFTIGDFRQLDVEIPRFSYRVLYEYKVPHETAVIFYSEHKEKKHEAVH